MSDTNATVALCQTCSDVNKAEIARLTAQVEAERKRAEHLEIA